MSPALQKFSLPSYFSLKDLGEVRELGFCPHIQRTLLPLFFPNKSKYVKSSHRVPCVSAGLNRTGGFPVCAQHSFSKISTSGGDLSRGSQLCFPSVFFHFLGKNTLCNICFIQENLLATWETVQPTDLDPALCDVSHFSHP